MKCLSLGNPNIPLSQVRPLDGHAAAGSQLERVS
jgi:hypothetical protein